MHREKGPHAIDHHPGAPKSCGQHPADTPFRPPDAPQRTPGPRHPRPVRPLMPSLRHMPPPAGCFRCPIPVPALFAREPRHRRWPGVQERSSQPIWLQSASLPGTVSSHATTRLPGGVCRRLPALLRVGRVDGVPEWDGGWQRSPAAAGSRMRFAMSLAARPGLSRYQGGRKASG